MSGQWSHLGPTARPHRLDCCIRAEANRTRAKRHRARRWLSHCVASAASNVGRVALDSFPAPLRHRGVIGPASAI